jgi:hypothetical protein
MKTTFLILCLPSFLMVQGHASAFEIQKEWEQENAGSTASFLLSTSLLLPGRRPEWDFSGFF